MNNKLNAARDLTNVKHIPEARTTTAEPDVIWQIDCPSEFTDIMVFPAGW